MNNEATKLKMKGIPVRYTVILLLILSFAPLTKLKAQDVRIKLSDISTTMKKYNYSYIQGDTAKTDITFIAVKAADGSVKTCFDACDACFIYYKGLSQSGTDLRCNSCGNRYHISELGVEKPSDQCWPGYLPNKIEGDQIVLKPDDLIKGKKFFFTEPYSGVEENKDDNSIVIVQNQDDLVITSISDAQRNFKIYSVDGNVCKTFSTTGSKVSIDIKGLSIGTYILSIDEGGKIINKLINISR